ncbi:type I secretion C-terminal target domain-containing protein, partial [Halomonas salifodinae]
DLSGLTTNTDGVAGDEVVWVRNSDSEIVGQIGGVTAITLSLSSVDLAAGTVQVTATLADNFQHLSGNDENTLDLGSVNVVATDSDGDTAVGAVNPKVVDDVPIDFMPTSGILNNNSGSSVTESLNTLSALGADNYGGSSTNVTFDAAQEGDSGFTSNGLVINYYVSADGKTLTASTSDTEGGVDPGNTVFTADIDDAFDEYTLTMVGTIDNGFGVSFEDLSGTGEAGNSSFKIVESSDVDSDLEILFTPLGSAGTINSDSDDVGVDSQFIDTGDGLRVDFGRFGNDDKGTGNGNDDTFVIDGKETINGFRFGIDQIAGGSTASLRLGVFDANSPLDNDLSNDVKDIISKVEVYNDQGGLVATWNGVDGEVNGITFSSGGGEVTVSGLGADYDVVTFSADGYDSIEIYHEKILDTDGKFSLNDLKVSQSDTGDPVDLSFDTILTDTDGDTATGTIEVTAAPAEADILGTSGNDDLVGDSGDNFLFAGGGDDTLTGGAGDDILWGGPGADTFVWNLGDEGTDSDPAEDEVTDFTLGDFGSDVDADKLDFSDILSSMGDEVDPAYLQATDDGVNTTLHISTTGGMTEGDVSAADQTILLEGIVTTIADLQSNNQLDIE